jgi:hypothetical protein
MATKKKTTKKPIGYTRKLEEFAQSQLYSVLKALPKRAHSEDKALGLLLCAHILEHASRLYSKGSAKKKLEKIAWLYSESLSVEGSGLEPQVSFRIVPKSKNPAYQ